MAERSYTDILNAERRFHIPPFAFLADVTANPNPETPRNWPLVDEGTIREHLDIARLRLVEAIAGRPEYQQAIQIVEAENDAVEDYPETEARFMMGEYVVSVPIWDGSDIYKVGVAKASKEDMEWAQVWADHPSLLPDPWAIEAVEEIEIERKSDWKGDVREDYGGHPMGAFFVKGSSSRFSYEGPSVHTVGKPGTVSENMRLPQKNTTAAFHAILDFARRVSEGNLAIAR